MNFLSLIRRGSALCLSPAAYATYRSLSVGQPLALAREPMNKADPNAVLCLTLTGQPCGYLAAEDAAFVSPAMASGQVFLAKVASPPSRRACDVFVWQEGNKAPDQMAFDPVETCDLG